MSTPVEIVVPKSEGSKTRRRRLAILAIGLIAVWAVWQFSVFDPAQAARKGHYFVVAAHVRIDSDIVNRQIDGTTTLLYVAARWNQAEIVKLLIESGANPDLPAGRSDNDRPVHAAAEHASPRVMKLLADAGADLNSPGGWTSEPPIMIAARYGQLEVVRVLLDAGVDPSTHVVVTYPHIPDSEFVQTTLQRAATRGYAQIVELLLEHGAAVTYMVGDHLETELRQFCLHAPQPKYDPEQHYPEWLSSMPKIVDLLVEKLGDVIFRHDQTILHEAFGDVHPGKFAIGRHLIEHYPKLNVNAVNIIKETPLHAAVSRPNIEGVKYLLENCPQLNVNATNSEGWTPLRNAENKLKYLHHMDFRSEDEEKHHEKEVKQIIELLKSHGGRVDEEAEKRVRDARPK